MLQQIIIDNIEWLIVSALAGVVAYTTFKIKLNELTTDLVNLREATREEVKDLKSKLEAQADVIHELRRKQGSIETELKYGKESVERQLATIEGYMIKLNNGKS